MAANDDVLIVGKLDSKELEKSINDLIDFVGDKTTIMAGKFDSAIDKMKSAMKDFAITQKVSVDLMKEAWKDMSASFDAMVAAQSGATGGGKGKEPKEYAPNTIGALEQEIAKRQQKRKEMELDSDALRQENKLIEERNRKLAEQKGLNTMAAQAKKAGEEIRVAFSHPANSLEQAEAKLAKLKALAANWKGKGVLDETQWNKIQNAIDRTEKSIEKFKMSAMTLKDLKLLPEKSVDDITKKLQALKHIQIDPKNATQVKKLGDEYQRLSRMQNELLGRSIQLTKSNNYLAQSFGYIRNRIVYALTLGAATSFVKQVYDIRAQYELLERSLGVLIGSFERGSRIFQELNTMALKSPFTLMELGTAAKQLTAYNFQANEVVNTTRRLADLSAALGVPMERLTYNLGQIRAQTVLTARDARDFANAGLPIVKSLADHFSELEGRVVSTGDVFDRMSKKAVSYNDVMAVLNKMTDEGGKFFDFQAKQAETLRVQLANLTLAWNNMLNAVGEENQGMLTLPITALKSLFQNWKELSHVISEVVIALGLYKGTQLVVNKLVGESAMVMKKNILANKEKIASDLEREALTRKLTAAEQRQILNKKKVVAADYQAILSTRELSKTQALLLVAFNKNDKELMKALVKLKLLKKSEIENITVGKAFSLVIKQMGISLASLGRTIAMFLPQMAAMAAIGAIVEVVYTFSEISDKIRDINKSIVDSSKESADSIAKFFNDYKETIKKVKELSVGGVYGKLTPTGTTSGANFKNIDEDQAKKAWQAIKEQIELSSAASSTFIDKLMQINDINDRVRAGFYYLEKIHDANGALETLDEKAIDIAGDWSKWWNLWTLPDGLIDNLKDYSKQLDKVIKKWGSLANAREAAMRKQEVAEGDLHDVQAQFYTFSNDLKDTISSMFNAFSSVGINTAEGMREAFERSNNQILADANLSSKEQLQYRMAAEEEFIAQRKAQFKEEYDFEFEQGNAARAARVKEEEAVWLASFGSGKAVSQAFFDWLKNQHASEINSMFGKMSRRELEQMDWSQPKWQKWAQDNAESFSKQYGISFDKLKGLVADANTWKIFLKLTITTDEKSVYDTLKDADAAANAAWTKIQRLKQRQAELNKIPATSLTDEQNEEAKNLVTELTHAQNDYNDAVAKGGHASKQAKANAKAQKTAEQEVNEALRQELSIIREVQSNYDKLRKSGVDDMQAAQLAAQGYADTLSRVNNILAKYGISKFNAKDFAGKDTRAILETLQKQRNDLIASGKVKTAGLKDMDVEIQKLTVEAKTYDYKKITDGLNSELGKIKDEYELAVELDANPELGSMFADMFDIDVDALPQTFGEALERAQKIVDAKLKEMNITEPFDLMRTQIQTITDEFGNEKIGFAKLVGQDENNDFIKALIQAQDKYRDTFKKNLLDTEKYLDDYVKKYGDYSNKVAEIERNRLKQIRDLNNAYYTEQMRNSPEYKAKENAINQGAQKQKDKAKFDAFKNSQLYIRMFENLDYVSTQTLQTMKERLEDLRNSMKNLSPEQLKQIQSQYQKITKELSTRNPFKGLIKNLKDYRKAVGKEGKQAQKDFADKQKEYDAQLKIVTARKKEYEAAKQTRDANDEWVIALGNIVNLEDEKLAKLKQELDLADKLNQKYDLMRQTLGDQADAIAKLMQVIAQNLQSLAELRDLLSDQFELDLGDSLNGVIDGLAQTGQGISKAVSSAQSGDVFGVVSGVVGVFSGIADGVASIFGDGSARTRRLNKEIERSVETVRQLNLAYKELEYQVNRAMGAEEMRAKKSQIENKKAQLEELKRQMQLEQSKRSKDRDDDAIKQYQESIKDLEIEIREMVENVTNDLLGGDLKAAAESFVDVWVQAWREGGDTMEALGDKFDDMIDNMIMKSIASRVVSQRLKRIWDEVDKAWADNSEGGSEITMNELSRIRALIGDKSIAEAINDDLTKLYGALGIAYGVDKDTDKNLSALQQGIQGITEDTAGALEAYMNGVSQQVYLHSELLTQIRDAVLGFDLDVQVGTLSQMLLQLQESYQVQLAIQNILNGWSNPSGMAVRVEMV